MNRDRIAVAVVDFMGMHGYFGKDAESYLVPVEFLIKAFPYPAEIPIRSNYYGCTQPAPVCVYHNPVFLPFSSYARLFIREKGACLNGNVCEVLIENGSPDHKRDRLVIVDCIVDSTKHYVQTRALPFNDVLRNVASKLTGCCDCHAACTWFCAGHGGFFEKYRLQALQCAVTGCSAPSRTGSDHNNID
jgi:hypothetical protein